MAERLTQPVEWNRPRPAHPRAYSWEDWVDGSPWRIVRGVDFSAKVVSMVSQLQRAARERGLKVRILTDRNPLDPSYPESITFQFYRS